MLEQIQAKALCALLDLPRNTPYLGLLNEIGMWRIEERVTYRKLMLYHNLQHSSNDRLCKRIIDGQENMPEENTYSTQMSKKWQIH